MKHKTTNKRDIQTRKNRYAKPKINTGEGLTEQSHAKECDMNYILREYTRTGFIKHAKENQGRYDDISVQDFQTAMFQVTEANNMFNELPGHIRKEFENDTSKFLEFVQNPQNKEKMEQLGIIHGNDGFDATGVAVTAPTADEGYKHDPRSHLKTPGEDAKSDEG